MRTTTADDGEVWDLGEFEVRENSDNEMNAQTSDDWPSHMEQSQPRPESVLVDASGEAAPESIDELDAPPMPQLDAGLTLSSAALPEDLAQPGDDEVTPGEAGEVVTPAGTLQLESVATLDTLPVLTGDSSGSGAAEETAEGSDGGGAGESNASEGDLDVDDDSVALDPQGEPHGPADGESFMLLDYEFTPTESENSGWGADDGDDYTASLALNDGSAQQTIAHFGQSTGMSRESSSESGQLLVSVAEDDASLVVSASGVDQEIDLPSGERRQNEVTQGYYRDVTQQDENHEFSIDDQEVTVDDDEHDVSLYMNLQQAGLTAFTEDGGAEGWADEGMAWLVLEFDAVLEHDSFTGRFLDYDPAVDVTDENGDTYSASRSIETDTSTWNETYQMAVQVPADAEELTFTQSMETRLEKGDDTVGLDFATEPYTVNFPQEDAAEGEDAGGGADAEESEESEGDNEGGGEGDGDDGDEGDEAGAENGDEDS